MITVNGRPWKCSQGLVLGVDVSRWQDKPETSRDDIDWSAAYRAGVRFALIKVTEGVGYSTTFVRQGVEQIQRANDAGVLAGPYHFATPWSRSAMGVDAVDEADAFLDACSRYKLPLRISMLDVEDKSKLEASHTPDTLALWCHTWLGLVSYELGHRPHLYMAQRVAKDCLHRPHGLERYPYMTPDYRAAAGRPTIDPRAGFDTWSIHQFSSQGRVPGIQYDVDLDVMTETTYGALVIP